MANDTSAEQARQLAELFAGLAESVDHFREANAAGLADTQLDSLVNTANLFESLSDQENVRSLAVTLAQVQSSVDAIIAATKDARQAVKTINRIQCVFSILDSAAALASAIAGGRIGDIVSSTGSLVQAVAASWRDGA